MKNNLFAAFLFSFCLLINMGCKKNTPAAAAITSTDPAELILGKWQVVKDSISTFQFAFSNGVIPIPGVYYGNSADYYLFQNNGIVIIQEGGPQLNSSYRLISTTSLLMDAFAWGDVHILTLTGNSFIWEKALTSGTAGTYYRRVYFRK